jgi:hypothetical protein
MIMKAIESESSSSCNEEAQSENEHREEETRVNVLNELEQEILKKHGSNKAFRYFHQLLPLECLS